MNDGVMIRCQQCGCVLGMRQGGLVRLTLHVRGGQKRIVTTTDCLIQCEKCGTVWYSDPDTVGEVDTCGRAEVSDGADS